MNFKELPIRRKIMAAIMLTSITVVILTVVAFMTYDLTTIRKNTIRDFATLSRIIAWNSTAAVAFKNENDAREVLSSLAAEPQIHSAALYDSHGKLFATYEAKGQSNKFPAAPEVDGFRLESAHMVFFEPVVQGNNRLGTLYLQTDLRFFYSRLELYAILAALIIIGTIIVSLVLSSRLQRNVSDPILALAGTARRVSDWGDYSVRATKVSNDELGLLTDAFNQMLTRIQEQTVSIQESENRLRLALEASRTGTWDWNIVTGHVTWDERNTALFGLEPGAFQGTYEHFLELIEAQNHGSVARALQESLDKKSEFAAEFPVTWPDGSMHNMLARGRAFYDETGRPIRMSGITHDITERKRSEEVSRQLAAIVESTDDAIIGKTLEGIVTSWNKAAERMFGYTAEEMVGQSIERIAIPEEAGFEERVLEAVRRGETRAHETQRMRKDGSRLEVALTVSPIRGAEGEIVGASSISRDITERINAQQSLERQARILSEQAQMLDLANVLARDLDDRIILWNTGMEKMYGWLRTETMGRTSQEILKTKSPIPLHEIQEILTRDGHWEGELVHTRKDGKAITVSSHWVLHRDPQGKPIAILEVNTDITERKQSEQEILRMNAELEFRVRERTAELIAANQELEAFTYSVAHDLRAPLRHIDAFTKIIFDDFGDAIPAEAQRYLQNIRKGSQNMNHLVDDLLNLARVGRQELKREVMPLAPLVNEVIADLKRETDQRDIEWHVDALPTAEVDPGLVKQVFVNLLSNAVKYTRPRPKTIIEVGHQQRNGELVIFVRDNGVGFNMKYSDKLFGVFQRLHRADEFEGTGVGLATVERIVRKHGGRIWAEAEMEKGATFYFTLHQAKHHEMSPS